MGNRQYLGLNSWIFYCKWPPKSLFLHMCFKVEMFAFLILCGGLLVCIPQSGQRFAGLFALLALLLVIFWHRNRIKPFGPTVCLWGVTKFNVTLLVNILTKQWLMCTVRQQRNTPCGFCVFCVCRGMWLFHVSSYKRICFPGSIRYRRVCVSVLEIKKLFPFFSSVPLGQHIGGWSSIRSSSVHTDDEHDGFALSALRLM